MARNRRLGRRAVLAALAGGPLFLSARLPHAPAGELPRMIVRKDPSCGCCEAWVDHVRAAGFQVRVIESAEMSRHKLELGVPPALASCHTAEVDGYVIEGHVPAGAISRLLLARPPAAGLALPGMPVGSPGMEVPGVAPETYAVILFGADGQRVFARYRGDRELPA